MTTKVFEGVLCCMLVAGVQAQRRGNRNFVRPLHGQEALA